MKRFFIDCQAQSFTDMATAFLPEIKANCQLLCEVVFVSEEEIKTLNREQRKIDSVTDVLSFPTLEGIKDERIIKADHLEDVDEDGNLFLGSIVVCEQRAKEQAEEYGHSYTRELNYLVAHGVCHLLGHDHIQEDERKQMRAVEERVLKRLGIER